MRRTAVIWDDLQAKIKFFVFDADLRNLDNVYINQNGDDKEAALQNLIYDEASGYRIEFCDKCDFEAVIRQGAFVIVCGFLP